MSRLDRVVVETFRGPIELPWASRAALLTELRRLDSTAGIVAAFEAVGATRPVELTVEQRAELAGLLNFWMNQVQVDGLPEGVYDLRCALVDEFTPATE